MINFAERLLRTALPRRAALTALAVMSVALLPSIATAQSTSPAADYTAELMKPQAIPDIVIGKPDAPVTIVEYASLTCGHCANFHNGVLPKLKEKYIDTGKARLILRDFPLDNLAAAGSMLARCAPADKSYQVLSSLFAKQNEWAFVQGNPVPALFKIASENGFTQETFDKCLIDQKLLENITNMRDHASKSLGVRSTPTFFVNGKRMSERSDRIESFDQVIEPLLKK